VRVSRLLYSGFTVNVGDVEDFLAGETLSEAFLQLLLMLSRSVWNSNTYVYPPWLVPHCKVSATLKRFVPGGGSKVRSLPAVACFPYLLPAPRTWVLYVVRADHDCPSKKSVTVVAPPALDLLALSPATTHLRSVFRVSTCPSSLIETAGDSAFFCTLVRACFERENDTAALRDWSELIPLVRAVAEDLLRLSQESPSTDVNLLKTKSKAVAAFVSFFAPPQTAPAAPATPPVKRPLPARESLPVAALLKRRRVFDALPTLSVPILNISPTGQSQNIAAASTSASTSSPVARALPRHAPASGQVCCCLTWAAPIF
jgi:hypothetical protein